MTRFGNILEGIGQSFNSLFSFWQISIPTLANVLFYWANFQCSNWPNIEEVI